MARRARIVKPDEAGPTDDTEETQSGADQINAETADDDGAGETASSSFSVVDHRGDDYVPPTDSTLGHIEIIESGPKRRGRKPGSGNRVQKATPNEIAQAAPLLVGLTNQVVVTWAGPECAMADSEAKFLTPSVARVLARLPKGAAEQVSLYTDPFIILCALGLWAARIQKIKELQAKARYQTTPFEAARAYGESGTNLGETTEPIDAAPIPPVTDSHNNVNSTATIFQGRNPV